jgi:hypothetical protein
MPQVIPFIKAAVVAFKAWAATTAFTVVGTAVTYGTIVKVALVIGSYAYQRQQTKKALSALAGGSTNLDQGRMVTVREPAGSRKLLYGQMRVGGTLAFIQSSGTTKEYLHMVIAHVDHECEEIGDIYLNDEIVPLDGSGNATGKYAGYVRVKKHLGADSQTVDTDLQTDVTSGVWSNDHRLRGVCYSYVRLTHNPDLFPSGIPNVSAVIKGKKVYDPRSTTTVWSANPALCLRDYLLLSTDRGGLGAASAEVDDAAVITAANICDEAVNLNPSGTELRYLANGLVDTTAEPGIVIAGLCSAMAGICPYVSGVFKMKAGAHTASVLTITEDDVRGGVNFSSRDSLRNAFNGVKGTYVSSKTDYQPADFPPVVNATYTTEDGSTRIWRDIGLGFTTSSSCAQRLAKIELERSRQDITVTLKTSLMAIEAHVGDVVALTLARYGFSAKLFEVVNCRFYAETGDNPILGLEWTLRETASAVWDWSNGEETTVDIATNTTLVDPFTVPTPSTPTLSTDNFKQPDGTITPRLKVVIAAVADVKVTSGGFFEVEYKKNADSTWLVWNPALRGNATDDYITDVLSGVSYDVRVRCRNVHGVRGSYSSTANATVGGDTTAPATPATPTLTSTTGSNTLNWADNTETDLAGYEVWRHTSNSSGSATKVAFVKANRWIDTLATSGTTYYYWLKAVDTSGNASGFSSVASGVAGSSGAVLGSVGGATTVNGTSPQAVTALDVTPSVPAGSRLITFSGSLANASGSPNTCFAQIYAGGSPIGDAFDFTLAAGASAFFTLVASETSSAGSRQYQMYAWGSAALDVVCSGELNVQ